MSSIACSEVHFVDIKVHQLQTNMGKVITVNYCFRLLYVRATSDTLLQVFVLGQIATEVFQDNPTTFLQVNKPTLIYRGLPPVLSDSICFVFPFRMSSVAAILSCKVVTQTSWQSSPN